MTADLMKPIFEFMNSWSFSRKITSIIPVSTNMSSKSSSFKNVFRACWTIWSLISNFHLFLSLIIADFNNPMLSFSLKNSPFIPIDHRLVPAESSPTLPKWYVAYTNVNYTSALYNFFSTISFVTENVCCITYNLFSSLISINHPIIFITLNTLHRQHYNK